MDARKESKRYIFTQNEKLLLLAIVSDYKHIIENKNTNSVTCKQKEDAWLDVTAKFNGSSTDGIVRTIVQLKNLYQNQKRDSKQNWLKTKFVSIILVYLDYN